MTFISELPPDLEAQLTREAARRKMTTPELLRVLMDELEADAPGYTARAALPFYVNTGLSEWEQALRNWAARQKA